MRSASSSTQSGVAPLFPLAAALHIGAALQNVYKVQSHLGAGSSLEPQITQMNADYKNMVFGPFVLYL